MSERDNNGNTTRRHKVKVRIRRPGANQIVGTLRCKCGWTYETGGGGTETRLGALKRVHERTGYVPLDHHEANAIVYSGATPWTLCPEYVPPHPGCQSCGRQPGPWYAPNGQWNMVIGGPEATDDPGGMLCASCYLDLAAQVYPDAKFRFAAERKDTA